MVTGMTFKREAFCLDPLKFAVDDDQVGREIEFAVGDTVVYTAKLDAATYRYSLDRKPIGDDKDGVVIAWRTSTFARDVSGRLRWFRRRAAERS